MEEKFIEDVEINGLKYEKWLLGYNQTSVGYIGCDFCDLDATANCLKGECHVNDFYYLLKK